jgi:hypothetical protein
MSSAKKALLKQQRISRKLNKIQQRTVPLSKQKLDGKILAM